jgi:hypothetical protein
VQLTILTNIVAAFASLGAIPMLVTVSSFREPYEAHLFRGRLEAEGVHAFVAHEMYVANKWPMSVALGGVKVQVFRDQFELARDVERACCRGDYRDLLRDEVGDLDDPVCPNCGGTAFRKRRPVPRAALAISVSVMFGTVISPTGWIFCCERCSNELHPPHGRFWTIKCLLFSAGAIVLALCAISLELWKYS